MQLSKAPTTGRVHERAVKTRAAAVIPIRPRRSFPATRCQATAPSSTSQGNVTGANKKFTGEQLEWFRIPPKIYFKGGALEVALSELRGKQRALVVTDKTVLDLGFAERVTKILDAIHVHHQVFYHVPQNPTFDTVEAGMREVNEFKPDVIIALGGGSPIDAAKVMWLLYEQPETQLESLITRSVEARKKVNEAPSLGKKAMMITIPTTSGTGAEVTPYAVLSDANGQKCTLACYSLTPHMAIVDHQLVQTMPKRLTANSGLHALDHALESFTSRFASEYTRGFCKQAVQMLFKYLPRAYDNGLNDIHAREKCHHNATMAGMAAANTLLGVGHSLAYVLGQHHKVPHGLANALLMTHVIRFNAAGSAKAREDYGKLSDLLQLGGTSEQDKVERLIGAIEQLKAKLHVPVSIKEALGLVHELPFKASVDAMAKQALEDLNTQANPVTPSVADLRNIYLQAWEK